jgi:hypothetical protein
MNRFILAVLTASALFGTTVSSKPGSLSTSGFSTGNWLDNTYWYVPTSYLPALLAINTTEPRVARLADQTV